MPFLKLSLIRPSLILCLFWAGACAAQPDGAVPIVTISQIERRPGVWDEQRVQVTGWAVHDFENHGLYSDRSDICANGEDRAAIYAVWRDDLLPLRTIRKGVFEGTFRNELGVQPDGNIVVSTAAPGPGPLENIRLVRWLTKTMPACR